MIMNYDDICCKCGKEIKGRLQFCFKNIQCLNCYKANILSKLEYGQNHLFENKTNYNELDLFINNKEKNLDLNENLKDSNKSNIFKKKKRRIFKKIIFNHKKFKINEFSNIIYKTIEEAGKRHKLLLMYPKDFKKKTKLICDFCNRTKLSKKHKMLNISCRKDLRELYIYIFKIITQEEFKQKLSKLSLERYDLILENKKDMVNQIIKLNTFETKHIYKKICLFCIYNSLINYKGINLLFERFVYENGQNLLSIKKKFEIISGLEELLINQNKNNLKKNNGNNKQENSNINANINLVKKGNLISNDTNEIFNEENFNIFNLVLEDKDEKEVEENNLIDFIDNNSNETQSIKVKKNKKIKNIIEKLNKKKINSIITKLDNNDKLNEKYLFKYLNHINNNNHFELVYNNRNKINPFFRQYFERRNIEQINPYIFEMDYNWNNNFININQINKSIDNINNNFFVKTNEQNIYDKLINEISILNNKFNLKININNNFIINNNINTNNNQIFYLKDINANLLFYKYLIEIIINYINNIGKLIDIYSYINESSLFLMNSIINENFSYNSNIQLINIYNLFSNLLHFYYEIKMMNSELCHKFGNI